MDVLFDAHVRNRYTIPVEGYGKLYWDGGTYVTQDKDLIKKLMKHPLYKRNDFDMVSNEKRVIQYIEGKEADKLTEEILDNLTRQGIMELGEVIGSRNNQPGLIKLELVGEPITDKVKEIIDFYQIDKQKDEVKEEIEREEETRVETYTNEFSTDMKAKEAVEYIENTSADDLEGFVPEDEERVTVKRAYEKKMS